MSKSNRITRSNIEDVRNAAVSESLSEN